MEAINEKSPSVRGKGFENTSASGSSPLEAILTRLDGVRKSGPGFIGKCPAHSDKTASLSVSEADNGNALLKCFAGCSAAAVVEALGLSMADLFPRRLSEAMTPQQRKEAQQWIKHAAMVTALEAIPFEINVILAGASKSMAGTVTYEDLTRMQTAADRIQSIKGALNGR